MVRNEFHVKFVLLLVLFLVACGGSSAVIGLNDLQSDAQVIHGDVSSDSSRTDVFDQDAATDSADACVETLSSYDWGTYCGPQGPGTLCQTSGTDGTLSAGMRIQRYRLRIFPSLHLRRLVRNMRHYINTRNS